ncbi:glutaredoxin family protein [Pseudomarimonas arenosa]|uniref:Glutaredoxin family protein n=1 Tax=Pseudomarimonas arenosa TaxID=2774145 RepID=A0AAW3ZJW8_9GAMM|nr:glutaredoxin family protein [Pseudomarimonas arenosa]MBD8524999.1 glutaredoxin family protein [Pseudomarimonas arenosa]
MHLTLYQRDECHLCDLAWEVLAAAGVADFDSVFIDGDSALEQRYGLRVPVLALIRDGLTSEIDWPFNAQQVRHALGI